ncbi:hypothetical protein DV532_26485 (plasmid) [Pseudomonas sp. Leaf58]|uniref:hypothetical protein n=1 Tax=Pseudomonas sp. Leaf58 TaxID=1736226 RepID=UPI0006FEAD01|nr:hypothetical protein [Pseudomonas sp. Leaf58]AYG47834.1 hypothetical protein DV532_26485 [Pseudomonas sp. Leaf58]KQN62600.1 hypothetical protein ASF02_10665 [Pseudomonas sp. Leaf58]
MSTEEIEDIEVVADLLSLARSEAYRDIDSFREAAHTRWASIGSERVDGCIQQLTQKLWDADYFNMRTEYQLRRPRKRKSASRAQGSV